MRKIHMLYTTKSGKYLLIKIDYVNKDFRIINLDLNKDVTDSLLECDKKEIFKYINNYLRGDRC